MSRQPGREETAQSLLRASAMHSFDPVVDIDWAAPLAADRFYLPPERVSLYGTPLWDGLTMAQRIELSKHEVASMASVGIWFEMILMQMLVRHAYDLDPTSAHVKYALTEIGDECRHSVMFADMITKFDAPAYGPGRLAHRQGKMLQKLSNGAEMFAAILIAEELLDTIQRESMADESLQPIVRAVSRIHVIEEARHVRYARDELVRQCAVESRWKRERTRLMIGRAAVVIATRLVHPRVYAAVGIEPAAGSRAARANPHRRETLAWAAKRLVPFFDDLGLIDGPAKRLWRRSGLLAA